MTIKDAIAKIKAAPKVRAAVRVANQAEAARLKRDWAVEDAIRDTHAKVMHLAEHADTLVADAVRNTAADAINRGVLDAKGVADRRARMVAQRHRVRDAHGREREEERKQQRTACRTEHHARVVAAGEAREEAHKAAYAQYVVRHRKATADESLYQFPSTLGASQEGAYREKIKGMSRRAFCDLISDEYDEHIKLNRNVYDSEVEAAKLILAAQLAAIDRGDEPPAPENIPGLIIVNDDGTVTETGNEFG